MDHAFAFEFDDDMIDSASCGRMFERARLPRTTAFDLRSITPRSHNPRCRIGIQGVYSEANEGLNPGRVSLSFGETKGVFGDLVDPRASFGSVSVFRQRQPAENVAQRKLLRRLGILMALC